MSEKPSELVWAYEDQRKSACRAAYERWYKTWCYGEGEPAPILWESFQYAWRAAKRDGRGK
jgi:hypothetical protein